MDYLLIWQDTSGVKIKSKNRNKFKSQAKLRRVLRAGEMD